ncbi:MFS transporter [Geodermatophilus sp. SYSU D00079]
MIVVSSALAGSSDTVGQVVGFRAGWGLGIAAGPLLGGLLGDISWRGPFFGVAGLMAIALVATVVLLDPTPRPARPGSLGAPLAALRHRGLLTMSLTALLYNWGFFTMMGYAPFPMGLSAMQLGLVFFGWGLLVAFSSVIGAPALQRRVGTAPALYAALGLFAVDLVVMAVGAASVPVLVVTVVVSGAFIGINNTLTTQAVMLVAPVERPVASAAYGFVRFLGGGLAPFAAGELAEAADVHLPFSVGAAAVVAGIAVLATGHRLLARADAGLDGDGHAAAGHDAPDDVAGEIADEFGGAPAAIDGELQGAPVRPRA